MKISRLVVLSSSVTLFSACLWGFIGALVGYVSADTLAFVLKSPGVGYMVGFTWGIIWGVVSGFVLSLLLIGGIIVGKIEP